MPWLVRCHRPHWRWARNLRRRSCLSAWGRPWLARPSGGRCGSHPKRWKETPASQVRRSFQKASRLRLMCADHEASSICCQTQPTGRTLRRVVNHVVAGDVDTASSIVTSLEQFPILLTRDFDDAKRLIREYAGESSRYGLVASSGAMRLRADGVELKRSFATHLDFPTGSSGHQATSGAATNSKSPRPNSNAKGWNWTGLWSVGRRLHSKRGFAQLAASLSLQRGQAWPHWRQERNMTEQEFIRNKYRVLLTRARFGTVIYVAPGSPTDQTRNPAEFDSVTAFLVRSGLAAAGSRSNQSKHSPERHSRHPSTSCRRHVEGREWIHPRSLCFSTKPAKATQISIDWRNSLFSGE